MVAKRKYIFLVLYALVLIVTVSLLNSCTPAVDPNATTVYGSTNVASTDGIFERVNFGGFSRVIDREAGIVCYTYESTQCFKLSDTNLK